MVTSLRFGVPVQLYQKTGTDGGWVPYALSRLPKPSARAIVRCASGSAAPRWEEVLRKE